MACRITNIAPKCNYQLSGITDIQLLDFDDFGGFSFKDDSRYDVCLVSGIRRYGSFAELSAPSSATYTGPEQGGRYTHTLTTFVGDLTADTLSQLTLATNRRYVVIFRGGNNRLYAFGYEAGATVTYSNQTADGIGSLVTITAVSSYPLFEVEDVQASCTWGEFVNIWEYAEPVVSCTWGDFINIWVQGCTSAYSTAYSKAYNCNSEN